MKRLRSHERESRIENRYTDPSNCGSRLTASLTLEIKSDLCVNAIVCDFAVVYFCGEFLDVKRANIPQCFRTSSTAPCAASSKLFGDCDISSMTLTTLAMVI